MMRKAETHENPGFGQTVFSIYHNPPKCHPENGSFFVLVFWGNRSLWPKERFPQTPSEKGDKASVLVKSIFQPLPIVHEGGGAGLVDVVVAGVPMQLQVAAGQLHLHGAVTEPGQHGGD